MAVKAEDVLDFSKYVDGYSLIVSRRREVRDGRTMSMDILAKRLEKVRVNGGRAEWVK